MKYIELTKGQRAKVDDADYEALSKVNWYARKSSTLECYYAVRHITPVPNGPQKTVPMHRAIMNPPDDMEVDHRDRDTLNNQRSNLRICTPLQNSRNQGLYKTNTSGLKGVVLNKPDNKWVASIKNNGLRIHIGIFHDKYEAGRAYDAMAKQLFGDFAKTNADLGLL